MNKLCGLLSQDLSFFWGECEGGPNGAKKTFLNVGKVFLRALAKNLGLRDAVVRSDPGGIGVSGSCCLYGMWEENGVYVCIDQFSGGGKCVMLYRTIRNLKDNRKDGYNNLIRLRELEMMTYGQLLDRIGALRKDYGYGRAA